MFISRLQIDGVETIRWTSIEVIYGNSPNLVHRSIVLKYWLNGSGAKPLTYPSIKRMQKLSHSFYDRSGPDLEIEEFTARFTDTIYNEMMMMMMMIMALIYPSSKTQRG